MPEAEEATTPAQETQEETVSASVDDTTSKPENGKSLPVPSAGPCCFCVSQVPGSTGDKKVDEMIDDVHQHLQEAGKALATLSENFEHELKVDPCTQIEPS